MDVPRVNFDRFFFSFLKLGPANILTEKPLSNSEKGRIYIGRGLSTDIIEASAKAYIDAINRMVSVQQKSET